MTRIEIPEDLSIPTFLRRRKGEKPATVATTTARPGAEGKSADEMRLDRLSAPARALFVESRRRYMTPVKSLDDPSVVRYWEEKVAVVAERAERKAKARELKREERKASAPPKMRLVGLRQIVTEMSEGRKVRVRKRDAAKACEADSELKLQRGRFPPEMVERVKRHVDAWLKKQKGAK